MSQYVQDSQCTPDSANGMVTIINDVVAGNYPGGCEREKPAGKKKPAKAG